MEKILRQEDSVFRLFVYGTLKRGYENHDLFCGNALDVEEAATYGTLYGLPFGFPALLAPSENILAVGTTGYAHDAAKQRGLNVTNPKPASGGESKVFGEVFTFDDPAVRLSKLDHLEGFDPEGPSLYRRVLVPVETVTDNLLAWAYAVENPAGTHLPGGLWPS